MNHGLCNAGISVWSWISGLRMLMTTKTVANTVEKGRIHRYFHLQYVNRPDTNAKKEYQRRVSPIVLIGGRPREIQRPIMKVRRIIIPPEISQTAGVRLPTAEKTEPTTDISTATEPNHMNRSQLMTSFLFAVPSGKAAKLRQAS